MDPNPTGAESPAARTMNADFTPLETLDRALRNWWVIALMMVLGAGAGWLVHQLQPPIFETKSAISVAIDFTHTGTLTDVEEDYAIGVVGDVIGSSAVMGKVAADAQQAGYAGSAAGLAQNTSMERYNNVWVLRVRDRDPQAAAWLANDWAQAAYSILEEAHAHALAADRLTRLQASLASCLEQSVANSPARSECNLDHLGAVQTDLTQMDAILQTEQAASRGTLPYTTYSLAQTAPVPAAPAVFQQGQMMLAGALIGLVLSLWLTYALIPSRIARRKVRYA